MTEGAENGRSRCAAGPRFTSRRMVREYVERFSIPALRKA
jgi:hypothetical protein